MTDLIQAHLDHRRVWRDFDYCYPVISRRSRGVSLGVNLNPDKVCNFDCVYCEVDRLSPARRGDLDLDQIEQELGLLLDLATSGEIYEISPFDSARPEQRRLNDIAFSGDGEPTTAKAFAEVVARVAAIKRTRGLDLVKLVLITDASRLQAPEVVQGLETLMAHQGEIWAKLDAGTEAYYREICRLQPPGTHRQTWREDPGSPALHGGPAHAGGRCPPPPPVADGFHRCGRALPFPRPAGGGLLRSGGVGLMGRSARALLLVAMGLVTGWAQGDGALPPPLATIRLVAVGDILMHQDVKRSEEQIGGGFPALWADLVPLFKGADLAFGNLETPVAPTTGRPGKPFQFNAPASLPPALRASGFTVISTANNHAFDQGRRGVAETLDRLRQAQLTAIGSGEDRPRAEALQILERNGLKVAFLGFTDIFNLNLDRKATEPWVRPLELESALAAVREARSRADIVVVSIHWGNEYQHTPTKRQRYIAQKLVAAGCDLLLGHHPHVLQPMELMTANGRRALVAYSLGNFISNQDRMYRADLFPVVDGDNRDGAALEVTFERRRQPDGTEAVVLAHAGFEPLWTENNWGAGKGVPRRIRVIRVAAAEARARAELDRLEDPVEGPADVADPKARMASILAEQEVLRTLILRRRRIAEILGQSFEEFSAGGTSPAGR
jgi:poly-gamma-glutamate synthesis protein (capsule biosynthesis protein)